MVMPFIKALVAALFITCIAGMFIETLIAVVAIQNHASTPIFIGAEGFGALITLAIAVFFFQRAYAFERYGDARAPAQN